MKGFEPCLFDKLFPDAKRADHVLKRLSAEELKEVVARDIEALLNTRMVFTEEMLVKYIECQRSILTYGVLDFSGRSLASFDDRVFICKSLERAIVRHEPRLTDISVKLGVDVRSTSMICFSISATLDVGEAHESVVFDATLKPSTLQYSVRKGRNRG